MGDKCILTPFFIETNACLHLFQKMTDKNYKSEIIMKRTFKEALEHRRSHYMLGSEMMAGRKEIEEMVSFALMHVPSAFNSQSSRIVLLMGNAHRRLWQIVKDTLQAQLPAATYTKSEKKINDCFAAGYGTLLFWEDTAVVERLQRESPLYADSFPQWSQHTSAMHQLVLWCMLEDVGLGASLQHYNPLIDSQVRKEWQLPASWQMVAQMPFGYPLSVPEMKKHEPLANRMLVFD